MGNVIKYGTHIVLCLVVAVVFAMRIRRNKYRLYSWVARDVTKNQTKKLSILLSFCFHEVLQYLNTFT